MALSNYTELQAAMTTWLNRSDLTAQIPDFITLAESRLNREMRLRVMETEAPLTIADGARTVALPADYLEPLDLWAVEAWGRRDLRYLVSPQTDVQTATGTIHNWTITGPNIEVERPVSGAMSLVLRYLASFSLSDVAPTNWLLTNHPDAYLFTALVEAGPYLRDDNLLAVWATRSQQSIDEINRKEARSKGLSTLSTDLPRSTRWNRARGGYGTCG